MTKRHFTLCLLALVLAHCKSAPQPTLPPAVPGTPITLTIVGTNDVHGWVMATSEEYQGQTIRSGGLAAFGGYLKLLRQANPNGVLLVDAGDLFQGTLASNLTEGSVVIEAFNALGYDAAAIGNHEFDYGPIGPAVTASTPGADPFGALKARIAQAHFPLLSANIYEKEMAQRPAWLWADGTAIVERKGVRIGIIGLTTPQTPTTTMPINVSTLSFEPLATEALAAAKRLRERGAELVVAVVHGGGRCPDLKDPRDVSSCDRNGEVFDLLGGVPAGTLDAVVAGHTHAAIGHFINGTPVIESLSTGKAFGTIELKLDPTTHRVLPGETRLRAAIPICETVDVAQETCEPQVLKALTHVEAGPAKFMGQTVEVDQRIAQVIEPALLKVTQLQHKPLDLNVPETLGRSYEAESALGSLLADSLRFAAKADVAVLNPGGLRADMKAGPLTYGAVFEVLPFDNAVATLELTGEELQRLLRAAFDARKGVFQVSGLELRVERCPGPNRLKGIKLEGGKAVDPAKRYRVTMPDFLARGGDGLGPVLSTVDPARIDLGNSRELNFRDSLVAYWQGQKRPLVAPKPGRVTFVGDGAACRVPPWSAHGH